MRDHVHVVQDRQRANIVPTVTGGDHLACGRDGRGGRFDLLGQFRAVGFGERKHVAGSAFDRGECDEGARDRTPFPFHCNIVVVAVFGGDHTGGVSVVACGGRGARQGCGRGVGIGVGVGVGSFKLISEEAIALKFGRVEGGAHFEGEGIPHVGNQFANRGQ